MTLILLSWGYYGLVSRWQHVEIITWGYEKGIAYLLLGIGFTACASKVCTELPCNGYLVLSIDAAEAASGEIRIVYDEVDVECEPDSANNPCWIGFKPDYRPDWVPSGAVLLTSDTPTEVTITVIGADGEERTKTIRPSYEVKEPTGPGCGTCSAASEVVRTIASWPRARPRYPWVNFRSVQPSTTSWPR